MHVEFKWLFYEFWYFWICDWHIWYGPSKFTVALIVAMDGEEDVEWSICTLTIIVCLIKEAYSLLLKSYTIYNLGMVIIFKLELLFDVFISTGRETSAYREPQSRFFIDSNCFISIFLFSEAHMKHIVTC